MLRKSKNLAPAIASMVVIAGCLAMPAFAQSAKPPVSKQTLCGWVDNPTPANWTLTDRKRQWTIGTQGEEGLATMPDFGDMWVVTNGLSYGYGCACITATVDSLNHELEKIHSVKVLPIVRCRNDHHLPQNDRFDSTAEFQKSL